MKFNFAHIILLFLGISISGQISLYSFPDKKEVRENQKILFTIILEIRGDEFVQESALKMPDLSKFNTIGTSSNQHTLIDPVNGVRINQQIFYYVLTPKISGTVKLGSALVQISGKMYKSEPVDIFISEAEKRKIPAKYSPDVALNLEVERKNIYPNQPTVAVLRGFSRDFMSLRKFGEVKFPDQKNIMVHALEKQPEVIEPEGDDQASQILAVFLIFPKKSGNIEVEPFKAEFGTGKKISSNRVLLNVKKIPENPPKGYKNAVGNFTFTIENPTDSTAIRQGKAFPVTLIIRGKGNINNLEFPKIQTSGHYHFFKPKISQKINFTKRGVSGEKRATYLVVANQPGKFSVETEKFVYFNPEKNKFEDAGLRRFDFEIPTAEKINAATTAFEKINTMTEDVINKVKLPVIPEPMRRIRHKKGFPWHFSFIILAFGGLLAAFVLFLKKIKKNRQISANKINSDTAEVSEKTDHSSTIQNHILHLRGLLERKDYTGFFSVFRELELAFQNSLNFSGEGSFTKFLEKNIAYREAENYTGIIHRVRMEESSPEHSQDILSGILNSFEGLVFRLKNNQ